MGNLSNKWSSAPVQYGWLVLALGTYAALHPSTSSIQNLPSLINLNVKSSTSIIWHDHGLTMTWPSSCRAPFRFELPGWQRHRRCPTFPPWSPRQSHPCRGYWRPEELPEVQELRSRTSQKDQSHAFCDITHKVYIYVCVRVCYIDLCNYWINGFIYVFVYYCYYYYYLLLYIYTYYYNNNCYNII